MKVKMKALSIALMVVSVVLAVVSFLLLPDTVVTQFSVGSSQATTMAKLPAILLPTALGLGGGVWQLGSPENSFKGLIVSAVGILVFLLMLAVNL